MSRLELAEIVFGELITSDAPVRHCSRDGGANGALLALDSVKPVMVICWRLQLLSVVCGDVTFCQRSGDQPVCS